MSCGRTDWVAELIIAVGLRPFTAQNAHVTAQTPARSVKMAAQHLGGKRSVSSDTCSSAPKRRKVTVTTFEKWQKQFDKEHQTLSWLCCCKDQSNRSLVSTLFCDVCRPYEDK